MIMTHSFALTGHGSVHWYINSLFCEPQCRGHCPNSAFPTLLSEGLGSGVMRARCKGNFMLSMMLN